MVEHVAGDDRAHADGTSLPRQRIDPHRVVGSAPLEQRHVAAPTIERLQVGQRRPVRPVRLVRQQDRDHAVRPGRQIVPVQLACPLPCPALADGEEPRQPRPGGAIGRIEDQAPAAGKIDPRASDRADAGRLLGRPGTDDAGDGADVADPDRGIAEQRRGREQLFRARRPAQQREVGEHLQLDIVGHANMPCIHQLRSPVSASNPSPRRKTHQRPPSPSSTR